MALAVGVCLGDGTVILLRASSRSADSSNSTPIVVHDTALLGEAILSFQATGRSPH